MNANTNPEPPSWGVKVNTRTWGYHTNDCPSWANHAEREKWDEAGVVLWDYEQQQITRLHARQALDILNHLRTQNNWRQQGITVGEPAVRLKLSNQTRKRRKGEAAPPAEDPEEKPQHVLTNTMQLSVERTQALLDVLQQYENELRPIAEAHDKAVKEALAKAHGIMFGWVRAKESREIDIAARPVSWAFDEASLTWTCNMPPNRVTVTGAINNFFWQGCLERPHQVKHISQYFVKLEEALAWAEQELQAAATAVQEPEKEPPRKQRLSLSTLTPEHRERLTPYWIDPRVLEPMRITYRVLMEVEHIPISRESLELSFGEKFYYGEKYPTALQLARKLNLNPDRVNVEDMVRGLFAITSLTTYGEAAMAKEQANRLWEQSAITASHRSGQLVCAAYGIEEVETGFMSWIGWCGEWRNRSEDREYFMANQAFGLTLAYALNIADYRAYLGFSEERISDTKLLRWMHETRAESSAIPEAAREASRQWLKDNS